MNNSGVQFLTEYVSGFKFMGLSLELVHEPENAPNPNLGLFKDVSTTFDAIDTFDSNTGRLHMGNIGTDVGTAVVGAY
jgi:hypothetical protein